MTERLYYEKSYLTAFEATVLEVKKAEDGFLVRLDRSAFYPTSGGQPYDTGVLGGKNVLDVFVDKEGEVWHRLDGELSAGEAVTGEIDWARRFDHMQQHAGEHMLANAAWRILGGHTIGLHLGRDFSSIDMDLPEGRTHITESELRALEDDVNSNIQKNLPIRCYFPDAETLKSLPLRKPPTVFEHVRIVQVGDYEYCACGGTHPERTGEIGLVKILSAAPSRGKLRLSFVCGMRAFLDYRNRFTVVERTANALSTGWEGLQEQVEALSERVKNAEYSLRQEKKKAALREIEDILALAVTVGDVKIAAHVFDGLGMEGMREAANAVIGVGNAVALLADRTEKGLLLVFARSENVNMNIGKILSEAAKAAGGKGGGKPDFAQGSAMDESVLFKATELIKCNLT